MGVLSEYERSRSTGICDWRLCRCGSLLRADEACKDRLPLHHCPGMVQWRDDFSPSAGIFCKLCCWICYPYLWCSFWSHCRGLPARGRRCFLRSVCQCTGGYFQSGGIVLCRQRRIVGLDDRLRIAAIGGTLPQNVTPPRAQVRQLDQPSEYEQLS